MHRGFGVLGLTVALAGCAPVTAPPVAVLDPTPATSSASANASVRAQTHPVDQRTAVTVLATVAVKGRAPATGYDRAQFGPPWADVDGNSCNTRNDTLRRDLTGVSFKPGTRDCVVVGGELVDPYTARTIIFTKTDAGAVQVDHVVSLSDAWQKGAQQWSPAKRLAFANDPLNLLAVDGATNAAKGNSDAATWLPPDKAYRCALVARQTSVKARYGLWMTAAEHEAIGRVLSSCPPELAPARG